MRSTIGQSRRRRGAGFTLVELLVVVAILALLISMLVPSLAAAKERSRIVLCANKLYHIGEALGQYVAANHDLMPPMVYMDSVAYAWRKSQATGQYDDTYMAFGIYRNLIGTYMGLGDCTPAGPNSPQDRYTNWEKAMYTHFPEFECPSGVNMTSPYGWAVNPAIGRGEGQCYYAQNVNWASQTGRIYGGGWPYRSAYFPLFTDTSSAILLYEQWSGNGGASGGADNLGQPYSTHYKNGRKGVEGIGRNTLYADWHVRLLDCAADAPDVTTSQNSSDSWISVTGAIQRGNETACVFSIVPWGTNFVAWYLADAPKMKG